MTAITAFDSATLEIQQHLQQLDDAAADIASRPLAPGAIIDLRIARHGVAINAAVIRTADEFVGAMVDVLV